MISLTLFPMPTLHLHITGSLYFLILFPFSTYPRTPSLFLLFLKGIFSEYKILGLQFLPLSTLKMLLLCFLASIVSEEKLAAKQPYLCFSICNETFFLWLFEDFLFITGFEQSNYDVALCNFLVFRFT